MRRILPFFLIAVVVGLAAYYLASRHEPVQQAVVTAPQHGRVKIPRPRFQGNDYHLETETIQIPTTGDPVAHTIEAVLATANDERAAASAIPKGSRLLGLKVEDGVATVNLSSEFAHVNQQGDTGESLAQNTLRMALAQFDQVKTMRVLVDGKPFEGEHSGPWTDIPVRDATASGEERP